MERLCQTHRGRRVFESGRISSATPAFLFWTLCSKADAVNTIDHRFRFCGQDIPAPADASKGALIEASYRMLLYLFPDQPATLTVQYNAALSAIPTGTPKNDGTQVGQAAANSIMNHPLAAPARKSTH
jgi:hypothetical protein